MSERNISSVERESSSFIQFFVDQRRREEERRWSFSTFSDGENTDIVRKIFQFTLASTVLVLLFCGFYKVWERSRVLQLSFTYDRLLRETEQLERKNRKLRLELSTLLSPARLYRMGREVGLSPPKPAQVVNWKTVKILMKSQKNSKKLAKIIKLP